MNDISIYDLNGDSITYFTQWDSNQKIIVECDCQDSLYVDFWNKNHKVSYRMGSKLISDNQFEVEVPNILLIESETIFLYVCSYISDSESGRTEYMCRIPVKPKCKPKDYEFIDNIEIISLLDLKKRIIALEDEITNSENQRNENELERQSSENTRIQNESERKSSESIRISNENIRIDNEGKRAAASSNAVSNCQNATQSANNAVENVNSALNTLNNNLQNAQIAFSKASTKSNISSGESFATMFGKIQKWYDSFGSSAWSNIVNNLTTSTSGSVLDASQGKILKDLCDKFNKALSDEITEDDIASLFVNTTSDDSSTS